MLGKAVLGIVGVLLPLAVAAQAPEQSLESLLELARQDIKTQKVAVLTAVLDMDDATSQAFWPVYREFDLADSKIGDQRLALIKQYAAVYDKLDDVKAKQLANDWFKLQEAKLKLKKDYFKKVEKVTSASLASRFVQVQSQIDMLLDLEIASSLPLLEKGLEEMRAAPGAGK